MTRNCGMGQHDRQPSLKIAMPVIPNVDGLNVVMVFDLDLIVGKGQTDRLIVCNVIRLLGEHRIIRNATLLIRALKECKPLPMPKLETKVIRDSKQDFWINPDPDVRWICARMLWMHYLVGVSNFTKHGTNRPLIV